MLERWVQGWSDAAPFVIRDQQAGWLEGRVRGVWSTLLAPDGGTQPLAGVLLLAAAALTGVGWWYAARRPHERRLVFGCACAATALCALRLFLPAVPVPGLFAASPFVVAGLAALRPRELGVDARRLCAVAGLFVAAVLGAQYAAGGTGDWGGRYLHLALPVVAPVLVASLGTTAAAMRIDGRRLVAALAASALCLSLLGAVTYVRLRGNVEGAVERAHRLARDHGPLVMSPIGAFGRFSWRYAADEPYLNVAEASSRERQLEAAAAALRAQGVERFVFVDSVEGLDSAVRRLAPWYVRVQTFRVDGSRWRLAVFRAR